MKKFNKSTGFVIAVFALTSMLWADADFSVSFTASGGGSDYTMTVGMSPYATDGYDVGIDQYAPPAPPPPSFDAAIGWGGDRYYTQIVASTESEVEFDIQLQYPEGNTIVLTWDNSAWASYGTFVLQDAFGGAMINVDMNATTTHTLTNPAFNTLKLFVTATGLATDDILLPEEFALRQNYPNPFNPVTTIQYNLPDDAHVSMVVYDIMGRQVRTLVNDVQSAGYRTVKWNATNEMGQPVSAGMYFYVLKADDFTQIRKMVLLK